MTHYKVSMDKETRDITVSKSIALFLGVITLIFLFSKQGFTDLLKGVGIILGILILLSIYLYLFFSSPSEYILTENAVIIKRPFGKVVVKLSDIETINIIDSSKFLPTIRTSIRNSGVFGYTGSYMIKNTKTSFYIKRKKDNIMLTQVGKENIIISPDDIIMAIDLGEAIDTNK